MSSESPPLRILVRHSAHPKDVALAGELLRHLDVLRRSAGFSVWTEASIRAGDETPRALAQAIAAADVAVLLLSVDFFAPAELVDVELPQIVARHGEGRLHVVPVLLRACPWQAHPWLRDLRPLPANGKPLGSLSAAAREGALSAVAQEIARLVGPAGDRPAADGEAPPSTRRSQEVVRRSRPAPRVDPEQDKTTNVIEELLSRAHEHELRPCLLVVEGPERGAVHRLRRGGTVLGRAQDSDIRILDDSVSRKHAQIDLRAGTAIIEDLGSANGTLVADVALHPHEPVPLADGDEIRLGARILLKFFYTENLVRGVQRPSAPDVATVGGRTARLSIFISYGGPDEPFARKLNDALRRQGIDTFFFPENALPGERIDHAVRKKIHEHDRVILVCSRASLDRKGVLAEIEETLRREHRDGIDYLIPIRLDDYVLTGWRPPSPETAPAILDRVVADFEGADRDEQKFEVGLGKLIATLKR